MRQPLDHGGRQKYDKPRKDKKTTKTREKGAFKVLQYKLQEELRKILSRCGTYQTYDRKRLLI